MFLQTLSHFKKYLSFQEQSPYSNDDEFVNSFYTKPVKFPELKHADPICSTANVTVEKLSCSRKLHLQNSVISWDLYNFYWESKRKML